MCEGSGENIFVVRDGVIHTPPQTASILDGINRRSAIQIARDLGFEVVERDIARAELYLADEVYLTGTAAELVPGARDRRPPGRRRHARRDHARGPGRVRGRAARAHRALPRVAGPGRGPGPNSVGARPAIGWAPAHVPPITSTQESFTAMSTIQLYDATLRDGMQGGGMTLTADEKLRVVHQLDALGVDLIEAGFPSSNPKELELFELLAGERLAHAEIVAFGMTRRRGVGADADEGLRVLADCVRAGLHAGGQDAGRCTSRRSCASRREENLRDDRRVDRLPGARRASG